MEERKRKIGILRSLGVTRQNILYIFISETCVRGIVSSILGIPILIAVKQDPEEVLRSR